MHRHTRITKRLSRDSDLSQNNAMDMSLDATAQADLVRRGEVTALELFEASRDRIARFNPSVNAVIADLSDHALGQLRRPLAGPFAGVPMVLKDASSELAGAPLTLATRYLRDCGYRSTQTTELTRRFLAAGFIIVGKTNLPEMSNGATTEPEAFGPTRNPHDSERTVGGSSGGSAAAVASHMVPVAHGADATGSLRYPASACGVLTLKPTGGRVPSLPAYGEPSPDSPWAEFALTRSVRDLAGLWQCLADDPGPVPHSPGRLKIGLMPGDPLLGFDPHPECRAAVEHAGRALESLGHHVELAYPPSYDGAPYRYGDAIGRLVNRLRADALTWLVARGQRSLQPGDLSDDVLESAQLGASIGDAERDTLIAAIEAVLAPSLSWWTEFDVLVSPVMRRPPWRIGGPESAAVVGQYCFPSSINRQPALSLPIATSTTGLPIGVHFVGAPGSDELLLALAAQLEAAEELTVSPPGAHPTPGRPHQSS